MTTAPMDSEFQELFNTGSLQLQQMQWSAAEKTFGTCTKLRPKFAPAWANLTIAYFRQEKVDLALAAGHQSVELDPKFGFSWMVLASAQLTAGLLRDAAASAEKADRLSPGNSAALGTAAHVYEALGDYEAALKAARKARKTEQAYDPLIRVIAADALMMLQRPRAAIRAYEEVIANEDKPGVAIIGELPVSRAFRGKGLVHWGLGLSKGSRSELISAVNSFEEANRLKTGSSG